MQKSSLRLSLSIILTLAALCFVSCGNQNDKISAKFNSRIVIWTNNSEFAQYIELFNRTHANNKAVLVYKENPALSLPPAKDEIPPDIVVGSWLRTENPKKNFKSLDYLFDTKHLSSNIFYRNLLESGKKNRVQYLLPVSFNLPAVIFSDENKEIVKDNYTMTLEQIRKTSASYNSKNNKGHYTKIGFTPLSNDDFLYLVTKIYGARFRLEKDNITYNSTALSNSINALKDWIEKENSSATVAQDFAFRYLFMPYYRQVTSGRTLFAYTTSDKLFKVFKEQNLNEDYRWIVKDNTLPIEDDYTLMGIFKNAKNQPGATEFISWFFNSDSQHAILSQKDNMNLETERFGIAGGFSAVQYVTENILPLYYTHLLTNLPPAQMIFVPEMLPARWESYKDQVVEPYIKNVITTERGAAIPSIADLEKDWRKKMFD